MEEWIQLVIFIIFGLGALLTRVLSRKKPKPDAVLKEGEITLPPWGSLPMEEDAPLPDFVEVDETPTAPPPNIQFVSKPEPVKKETPARPATDSAPPAIPTVMGIPLSPQTFRQGIILAEILRPPKSLRQPPE